MTTDSLNLPEVVPVEGLEVPYDGVEADPEGPERLSRSASIHQKELKSARKAVQKLTGWRSTHNRICRITAIGVTLVLITIIILGTVLGVEESK